MASEAEQRLADEDQASSDQDQAASDQDQAASDRDHAATPPEPSSDRAYDVSRAQRASTTTERELTTASRTETALTRSREAVQRDETAQLRDLSALERDHAAEARDRAGQRLDESLARDGATKDEAIEALRKSGAAHRARADADRRRAAADRKRAAADRAQAALDRTQARIDLHSARLDDLTGVYTRGIGLHMLEHEVARAHRSGEPLVLAWIDVDGLKEVNDQGGHSAGDAVLRAASGAIEAELRPYDPIVRMGGDEFVCAFVGIGLDRAAERVEEINTALAQSNSSGSISVGLVELRPDETLEELTARGDAALYRAKGSK